MTIFAYIFWIAYLTCLIVAYALSMIPGLALFMQRKRYIDATKANKEFSAVGCTVCSPYINTADIDLTKPTHLIEVHADKNCPVCRGRGYHLTQEPDHQNVIKTKANTKCTPKNNET